MSNKNLSIDLGKVAIAPKGDYNSNTTYERLDLVKANNSGYVSIKDDNKGHAVTDTSWWMCVVDGSEAQAQAQAASQAAANALQMANSANSAAGNANTQAASASAATEAANAAANTAAEATEEIRELADQCRAIIEAAAQVEQLGIVPTSLTVEYPAEITFGNMANLFVKGILSPGYALPNLLYLGDDKAVSVAPNGEITVLREGESTIHVIPTGNTRLYKTIHITVHAPTIRLVNNRTTIRLDQNNNIRFN